MSHSPKIVGAKGITHVIHDQHMSPQFSISRFSPPLTNPRAALGTSWVDWGTWGLSDHQNRSHSQSVIPCVKDMTKRSWEHIFLSKFRTQIPIFLQSDILSIGQCNAHNGCWFSNLSHYSLVFNLHVFGDLRLSLHLHTCI